MPKLISDAGAISARIGYKYQDHVAAMFVLQMIADRRILRVECETSDDIVLLWAMPDGEHAEFVQVKTTDKDNKWTIKEIVTRTDKNRPTSLIEKSLLTDDRSEKALFRIVARRSVARALLPLADSRDQRESLGEIEQLASKLKARIKKTVSANGHDIKYWTENALWQAIPGIEVLSNQNLQLISRTAEDFGANPSHSHSRRIYDDLLAWVDKAASASTRTPAEKTITRQDAVIWWEKHLAETAAAQKKTSKPYRTKGEQFLVKIHTITESTIKRYGAGYDAQYERNIWRSKQLVKYLVRWLPEITLRASELVEIDQLNLSQKLESALRVIRAERGLNVRDLIAQLLLHSTLRHFLGTEPIACKLFHRSPLGDQIVGSAHIKPNDAGDELWLGRALLLDVKNEKSFAAALTQSLREAISPAILTEERQIILQLSEPQHLTSHNLGKALSSGTPVDDLIRVLSLPLLFVYDSDALSSGYTEDYKEKLVLEIESIYQTVKSALPTEINEVRVHVFLVPVEDFSKLELEFSTELELL